MAATKTCMRCMIGVYTGGKCSNCHRPEPVEVVQDVTILPVGHILHNQYFIGEPLGKGGFGVTYAAWDRRYQRRVAVKELFPSKDVLRDQDHHTVHVISGQEAYFQRVHQCFKNEAQMLMRLQNREGIVCLYHYFEENNTAYYVMEYLEGEDLNKRLSREGTMSWEEFSPIMLMMLKALDQLHAEGLIHRDITPGNIFLTRDGARLIDFGSVRAYQGVDHFTALVTQSFAPWEQYRTEGNQGPWTDIYALCVSAYYSISGKLPPVAPQRRIEDKLEPLKKLVPQVPAYVSNALNYGMAVTIEDRCKNVRELAKMLHLGPLPDYRRNVQPSSASTVECMRGTFTGRKWNLAIGGVLRLGREPTLEIAYPLNAAGISRQQCTLYRGEDGQVWVRDEKSSYGTYIATSEKTVRLEPAQWYVVSGKYLLFGQQEQYYIQ